MADGAAISATIKYSRDHDATWAVFHGSPAEVKEQAQAYFGLDAEVIKDKTPHEVILEGQQVAQGTASVADKLGGSIWPSSNDKPAAKKKAAPKEDPIAEHPFGEVLAKIEGASTEDELKAIFVQNKTAFEHEDVKAASKNKFESLKEKA